MVRKYRLAVWLGAAAIGLLVARPAFGLLVDMAGHWAAPLVGALEARGIVNGNDLGQFEPEAALTRAQLAKLLVAGLGNEDDAKLLAGYPSRFRDVPSWHWARGYIESLAESAIVEGYPDGTFAPSDTVSRVQMAAILVRAMGLTEQARVLRFEPTSYTDDSMIPAWGRGSVQVARTSGLMGGFEDGSFRPLQPVTRAEGTVALARLLSARGALFHLTGTLVWWDPVTLTGSIRDELGNERSFSMARDARYFRAGLPAAAGQVRRLDQASIVLGQDGKGLFMDSRFAALLVKDFTVSGANATGVLPDGTRRAFVLQPGALLYVRGERLGTGTLPSNNSAYLMLDRATGEVRVADIVGSVLQGTFMAYNPASSTLTLRVGQEAQHVSVARGLSPNLEGKPVEMAELQLEDQVMAFLDEAGVVVHMQVER